MINTMTKAIATYKMSHLIRSMITESLFMIIVMGSVCGGAGLGRQTGPSEGF